MLGIWGCSRPSPPKLGPSPFAGERPTFFHGVNLRLPGGRRQVFFWRSERDLDIDHNSMASSRVLPGGPVAKQIAHSTQKTPHSSIRHCSEPLLQNGHGLNAFVIPNTPSGSCLSPLSKCGRVRLRSNPQARARRATGASRSIPGRWRPAGRLTPLEMRQSRKDDQFLNFGPFMRSWPTRGPSPSASPSGGSS